jgi:sulfopyruvate decarboxylase subunit beta
MLTKLRPHLEEADIVLAALAGTTYDCFESLHRKANLYLLGMGMVTSVGLGMALALPKRKIIAFDTDGSLLLSPSILPVVGHYKPPNLHLLVFDNERLYGNRGGPPSQTAHGTDLAAMAKAAGIEKAATVEELSEFEAKIDWFLTMNGPAFLVAKTEASPGQGNGPRMDGRENKYQLVHLIEESENIRILGAVTR